MDIFCINNGSKYTEAFEKICNLLVINPYCNKEDFLRHKFTNYNINVLHLQRYVDEDLINIVIDKELLIFTEFSVLKRKTMQPTIITQNVYNVFIDILEELAKAELVAIQSMEQKGRQMI